MSAAPTNAIESIQASAPPPTKPAVSQPPDQESFQSRLKSELKTSETPADPESQQPDAKSQPQAQPVLDKSDSTAKAQLNAATADKAGTTAKANAAVKANAVALKSDIISPNLLDHVKAKGKQIAKATSDTGQTEIAKTVDGADPLAVAATVGVQANVVQGSMPQTEQQPKKEAAESASAAIQSARQTPQPEIAANAQAALPSAGPLDPVSALEFKTKHATGPSSIAELTAKPAAGAASAEGLLASAGGANGIMAVGGVGGQALQGGHSSGSSGRDDSPSGTTHAAAAGAPHVIASSPAQLDVGVFDDTHGWLRIRAELGAGGTVNATLTSADAAHESLRTALPEMTHYLGSESVNVGSIALHKFGDTSGGQLGSHAEGQQQGGAPGQHTRGDEHQQPGQMNVTMAPEDTASSSVTAVANSPDEAGMEAVGSAVLAVPVLQDDGVLPGNILSAQGLPWQVGFAGSGGWVNVSV